MRRFSAGGPFSGVRVARVLLGDLHDELSRLLHVQGLPADARTSRCISGRRSPSPDTGRAGDALDVDHAGVSGVEELQSYCPLSPGHAHVEGDHLHGDVREEGAGTVRRGVQLVAHRGSGCATDRGAARPRRGRSTAGAALRAREYVPVGAARRQRLSMSAEAVSTEHAAIGTPTRSGRCGNRTTAMMAKEGGVESEPDEALRDVGEECLTMATTSAIFDDDRRSGWSSTS